VEFFLYYSALESMSCYVAGRLSDIKNCKMDERSAKFSCAGAKIYGQILNYKILVSMPFEPTD